MEKIKLLEQNQEKILEMARAKAKIAAADNKGKTGELMYLMERWLDIELMKNKLSAKKEEK
jgi:hypothetical protein